MQRRVLLTFLSVFLIILGILNNTRLYLDSRSNNEFNWNDKWSSSPIEEYKPILEENNKEEQTSPPIIKEQLVANSYEEAIELSKKTGKKIFIVFYEDTCKPCNDLKNDVLSHPKVKKKMLEYIYLRVDSSKIKNNKVTSKYGLQVIPTLVITDKNGRTLKRDEGYMDVNNLTNWLS